MAEGAIAYEMNSEFAPVLRDRMHYFNTDPRCGRGLWAGESMAGGALLKVQLCSHMVLQ